MTSMPGVDLAVETDCVVGMAPVPDCAVVAMVV